jgi:predicted dehydrogenase
VTDEPVPVAVVGVGNMGANHVRVYDQLPDAELVEVVEPNPERAQKIAEEYHVRVVDAAEKLDRARAATVAVPNRHHRDVAIKCIEQELDVLIEKPLATTVSDARAIVDAARRADVILQVGHIERFNPAVEVLGDILQDEDAIALEAHRLGPFNEHLTEESVIFDLMIHDIDVIRALVDSPIRHVDAVGTQSRSEEIDHAIAHLKFENGVLGTTTASHVTHSKVRSLTATAEEMYIELDYQEQNITLSRHESEQTTVLQGMSGHRTETVRETPFVRTREPLKNELEHFLECVRTRRSPLVGADDGLAAVELANEIVDAVRSN